MPTSDSNQIPAVLHLVSEVKPKKVLDIGVGWGKYGCLFRVCLEGGYHDISNRANWRVVIDGIEAFPAYIGDLQKSVYDNIIISTVEDALPGLSDYDVIFMGDVIEHLPKDVGLRVIDRLLQKANSRLIIATPNGPYEQGAVLDNEYERHNSFWTVSDFAAFPNSEVYATKKSVIAVLSRNPIGSAGRRWAQGEFVRKPLSAALGARIKYRISRITRKLSNKRN
jgi:hypothetical protein